MSIAGIIGLIIAAIAGGFTALARVYKWGPFVENDEVKDFTDLPYMPPETSTQPVAETLPVTPTTMPKKPSVVDFCRAIELFEGGPGDASYRNNNPGNVRFNYNGGYLPIYGNVKCSPAGFAIFPTFEIGRLYLQNMVKGMIHNHPDETIMQFMTRYAPQSENPTLAYATFIAKHLGVTVDYPMKELV